MEFIQNIMEKIKERRQQIKEEEAELPDDVTRDKFLRSLRREDRLLDEEEEKEFLKKKIALRKKARMRKHLFGIKKELNKRKFNEETSMLTGSPLKINGHNSKGFFGKYKL